MRALLIQESKRRGLTARAPRPLHQQSLSSSTRIRLLAAHNRPRSNRTLSSSQQPSNDDRIVPLRDDDTKIETTPLLSQQSQLLPPLNTLDTHETLTHETASPPPSSLPRFSWKNTSYQVLETGDGADTPSHIILECLQWWTRQRPIQKSSTHMTWKLFELLRLQGNNSRVILNSVLDHWRLAIQNNIAVPSQVKDVLERVLEWERHNEGSRSEEEEDQVQKTYSILLKALSESQEQPRQQRLELVDTILQSMPITPSTVTINAALTVLAKSHSPSAYTHAQRLLRTMEARPNEISYTNVLETLSYSQHDTAIQEAEALLEEMTSRDVPINSVCYLQFLRLLTSRNQLDRAVALLEDLVQTYQRAILHEQDASQASVVVPTRHLFSAVMAAFARRGDYSQVEQLLETLQHLFTMTPHEDDRALLMPTAATLNSVLEAYAKKRTLEGTKHAAGLLMRLEEWGSTQNTSSIACLPDTTSYNTVLDAWAEVARFYPNAVDEAESLLETMLEHEHAKPDAYSYTTVMKAWSRSDRIGAAERCEGFLNGMWEAYERERRHLVKPNDVTYATAMYAWSRAAKKVSAAPYRAEALFRNLKQRYKDGDSSLAPTEAIYVSLITTWNRSITPQTKQQALARSQFYFDQMRAEYMAGNESMRPTAKIYNALLEGMKQAGDGNGADRIFQLMMNEYRLQGNRQARPNSYTFHSLITAWARSRSPSGPLRAEEVLNQMNDLYNIEGWDCKPTTVGFSSVLNCWAKSGRQEAPERAETILRHMEKLYQAGQSDLKPSTYTYATVLDAWANSFREDAPERAVALFDELLARYEAGDEACRPSGAAYMAVLVTWGKSARSDGALKALGLLNEMEERHATKSSHERPECLHFSAVINAFAQRGDVENAKALLDRIIDSRTIRPHAACFNGYIKAITRSGNKNAGAMAERVIQEMKEGDKPVQPDVITYTSCIGAWGQRHNGRLADDAVDRAQLLLNECISQSHRKSVAPNQSTFLTFARLLSRSTVSDKSDRAQWTLRQMESIGLQPSRAILSEIERCQQ